MNSISQLRQNAAQTVTTVSARFENIRALDQNPLFDKDERVGHVQAAADTWSSTASFSEAGEPLAFQWKSSEPNPYAEREMDAQTIENTESIEKKDGTVTFTKKHQGPTPYGFGEDNNGTIAILDSTSRDLLDASAW